ncbi:acyltransferase family protein, partial [Microbacterium sp. KNMS]
MSRVKWVDTARGIAIIAVVVFHATLVLAPLGAGSAWARYINLLDTFRMPLFFFASGLV